MSNDIRRRAELIEEERRAVAAKIAAEQKQATAALEAMRLKLQAIADELPEARLLGRFSINRPANPRFIGPDEYRWHLLGNNYSNMPYLVVDLLGKVTHNPYAKVWMFTPSENYLTSEDVIEEFRNRLAKWLLDDYPMAKAHFEKFQAPPPKDESGCAVFLVPLMGAVSYLALKAGGLL